jgi:peptide/nickel transport system permease protein
MLPFIARRLAQTVPTLLFVSAIVFAIMRATPGDPALFMLGGQAGVTQGMLQQVRHEIGLDQPVPLQYLQWLWRFAHGDLGRSYISHASVQSLIARRIPASVELAIAASMVAFLVAIPTGILSAVHRATWIDHLATTFVTAGIAMPGFWLATLLVLLFAVELRLLPPSGYVPLPGHVGENLRLLALPTATLAILIAAPTMRFLRSSMLDILGEDYLRTARAKGLTQRGVVYGHALRNALIPTVNWIGLQFAYLVGGSVTVEWVFGWPGVGWLAVQSVLSRDYLVVQGTVVLVAMIFILVNLGIDVLVAFLDPRIRYQ